MGSKKRPFYRIIATDSRSPRDGRFIETLGYYNPMTQPADVNIKEDLVLKWLHNGAVVTGNTESLLRDAGIMKKFALMKQGVPEDQLDAKIEELNAKETPPMSVEERQMKAAAKKQEAEAATATEDAEAAPESAETADATPEAPAEEAPAEEAPAEEKKEAAPAATDDAAEEPQETAAADATPEAPASEATEETPAESADDDESKEKKE